MASKVQYRVIYNRRKELDRNGMAPVVVEAYQDRNRYYQPTGIRLTPNQWDERKNEVKSKPDLNRLIRELISDMETYELTFRAHNGRSFALADFKTFRKPKESTPVKPSFTAHFTEQIERQKPTLVKFTIGRRLQVLKRLTHFCQKPVIEFEVLTLDFIERYEHYLRTVHKLSTNTIHKEHQIIRSYLKNAINKGLMDTAKNPYNLFKAKLEKVETIVLRPGEIARLEDLTFTEGKKHLAFYRDAFLFGYYSLLRIGDVTRLKQQHIVETSEGLQIELRAQKTGKINRLPLFIMHPTTEGISKPERLLKDYARTDGKPLFDRSAVKINKYLKEVMELAKIRKSGPITFHTARHSGITFLSQRLPITIVQQLAQHSNVQTTMGYTHLAQQDVCNALNQVHTW